MTREPRDVVVLVPDLDIAGTVEGLLRRPESIGTRPVSFSIARHLRRDSGCRARAAERLREYIRDHRYAIVLFDKHGCGDPRESRKSIQAEVEQRLSRNGWPDRCRAVVIEPELEAWIWTESRQVPSALGWRGDYRSLRDWLTSAGLWSPDTPKPADPKGALKAVLKRTRKAVVRESVPGTGGHRDGAPVCGSSLQRVHADVADLVSQGRRWRTWRSWMIDVRPP